MDIRRIWGGPHLSLPCSALALLQVVSTKPYDSPLGRKLISPKAAVSQEVLAKIQTREIGNGKSQCPKPVSHKGINNIQENFDKRDNL
jgi:hypothetical protein